MTQIVISPSHSGMKELTEPVKNVITRDQLVKQIVERRRNLNPCIIEIQKPFIVFENSFPSILTMWQKGVFGNYYDVVADAVKEKIEFVRKDKKRCALGATLYIVGSKKNAAHFLGYLKEKHDLIKLRNSVAVLRDDKFHKGTVVMYLRPHEDGIELYLDLENYVQDTLKAVLNICF